MVKVFFVGRRRGLETLENKAETIAAAATLDRASAAALGGRRGGDNSTRPPSGDADETSDADLSLEDRELDRDDRTLRTIEAVLRLAELRLDLVDPPPCSTLRELVRLDLAGLLV